MTFLTLILALLVEQWHPLRTGNALYAAFARYVNQLARSLNAGQYRDGVISWTLAVLPAVLIVFVVHLLSRQLSWIVVLFWNVAVLYIALGFRQFSHFYTDVAAALRGALAGDARHQLLPLAVGPGKDWRKVDGVGEASGVARLGDHLLERAVERPGHGLTGARDAGDHKGGDPGVGEGLDRVARGRRVGVEVGLTLQGPALRVDHATELGVAAEREDRSGVGVAALLHGVGDERHVVARGRSR